MDYRRRRWAPSACCCVAAPTGALAFSAPYTATQAGTLTIVATADPLTGPVVTQTYVARAVAAGSGVTPVPDAPPAVIAAQTVPRANATGVAVTVAPQLRFTEPVTHVPGAVTLTDAQGLSVPITLLGVDANGPIAQLQAGSVITGLTIQPTVGLRYHTTYTLTLTSAIVDTDTPTAKPLVAYTTRFTTFGPETIGGTTDAVGAAGLVVVGDRAYVADAYQRVSARLRLFDISDPVAPQEVQGPGDAGFQVLSRSVPVITGLGVPSDLAVEDASALTGGRVLAVSTVPQGVPTHPSNVWIYGVDDDQTWQLQAAVTLGTEPVDGLVSRIVLKGTRLFALTRGQGKGLQVVDLVQARTLLQQQTGGVDGSSPAMLSFLAQLQTLQQGFAQQAIVQTVFLDTDTGQNSLQSDLAVLDTVIGGASVPLAITTGRRALALVNPDTGAVLYSGPVLDQANTPVLSWGQYVAAAMIGTRPVAVIAGLSPTGQRRLAVVDLTIATAPRALSTLDLPNGVMDGGGRSRLVLKDGTVYLAGSAGTTIINVQDPLQPLITGVLPGMGGFMAVTDSNLLLSARDFYSTTPTGLQTAALGRMVIVPGPRPQLTRRVPPPASPPPGPVADDEELVNDVPVAPRVIGADATAGVFTLLANGVEVAQQTLAYAGNVAATIVARGTRKLRDAVWTMVATAETSDGPLQSLPRRLDGGQVALRLDADNDTRLTLADVVAEATGQRWAFWEADPQHLASLGDPALTTAQQLRAPVVDGLTDLATIRLTVAAPAPTLELRMATDFPTGQETWRWSLAPKVGDGLTYLTDAATGEAQRRAVAADCASVGGRLTGRCDAAGGNALRLTDVTPGTYDYVFRCERCPLDATRRLEVVQPATAGQPLATLDQHTVDVRPLTDWMAMLSARRGADLDKVNGTLTPVPGWRAVSDRPGLPTTVLVHGYGVADAGAVQNYRQLFRNLYWSGLPVLFDTLAPAAQAPAGATQVVGILWPGNLGPGETSFFPGDEFTAFQTGVPLGAFFEQRKAAGQPLNVIAHSLGNLAVNTAMSRSPSLRFDADRYVMVEAAVAAEAFYTVYDPQSDLGFSNPSLPFARMVDTAGGARDEGYPTPALPLVDSRWADLWTLSHVREEWGALQAQMLALVNPQPQFDMRWSTARFGNSPWRGQFAENLTKAKVWNFFNRTDQALEIVEEADPSPWRLTQIVQKPYVVGSFLGTGIDPTGMSWALIPFVTDGDSFTALWAGADTTLSANTTRRWAELAFQFQPVSGPVGAQPVTTLLTGHNVDMTSVGGSGGLPAFASHTYWSRPISGALPFFTEIVDRLRR